MSLFIKINNLFSINFFDLSPSFNTSVHNHNDWEFLYVDSGEVNCIVDGENRSLKQGDIMFHQPNKTHRTVCNGKKSASIFNVHFTTDSEAMECFKEKSLPVPTKAADALKRLMEECNSTYRVSDIPMIMRDNAPIGGEQMSRLLLEEFLILMIRSFENSESAKQTNGNQLSLAPRIEEICDYLKTNVYGKITLNDLVEKFHFSKSFLCEQFKTHKGTSPISYYLDLKITEAKRLLRENDLTISEISEMLSFESPEYFSRCFKKSVDRSPRDFRKMLINDANLKKRN